MYDEGLVAKKENGETREMTEEPYFTLISHFAFIINQAQLGLVDDHMMDDIARRS